MYFEKKPLAKVEDEDFKNLKGWLKKLSLTYFIREKNKDDNLAP